MSVRLIPTTRTRTVLLLLLAGACDNGELPDEVVHSWLLCSECTSGEFDSVRSLGDLAIPILKAALAGPPPADSARAVAQYIAEFNDFARWARGRVGPSQPTVPDSAAYVSQYLVMLFESYQARAAVGLDSLGKPAAKQALLDFWNTDSLRLRPRARRLVDSLVNLSPPSRLPPP